MLNQIHFGMCRRISAGSGLSATRFLLQLANQVSNSTFARKYSPELVIAFGTCTGCTPLWAPQEVARTLSASPPTTQRARAREVRARTPRGASGRAFLGGESPSPAARERGSGGPRRADLNQNHAVPRLSGRVRFIPYRLSIVECDWSIGGTHAKCSG